jgi:UDP-N-acetyl-D-glucosamine dehydrogenase
MKVTVIGMGKIGLPLAVNFARHGATVTGLDLQEEVVNLINCGDEPFPGERNLGTYLKECVSKSTLIATTNVAESIASADVIVICIPLIVDSESKPDFKNIDRLVLDLGSHISKGSLICFETTLPVGTTKDRFTPAVEEASGLKVGEDFYVVFSPERVLTGRVFEDLKRYPKLVGGVTQECTKRGVEFYRSVIKFDFRDDLAKPNGVWAMKNSEAAEFAKIAETTYRDVNIGLANEFSVYADSLDIDISEVIEAANSQPFSHLHNPGISVGGHCIPVYPRFYVWGNPSSEVVSAARLRNESMPDYAISRIKKSIGSFNNLKVGILGISYRPGVKESAFSGSLVLMELLKSEGAQVSAADPYFSEAEIATLGFSGIINYQEVEGLILHTAHPEFLELDFLKMPSVQFLYDGRKALLDRHKEYTFKYFS